LKLKLSDMANIADVVGAISIVVSLVYVGVQLNDSTRAVRSATANDTSAALSAWYTELGTNPQALRVFQDGITNPESLSREESLQFIFQLHGLMLEYQAAYYLSRQGTLDTELQESTTNTLLGVRDLPGFRVYWGQRKDLFRSDFRLYIEDLLANGTTNTNMQQAYPVRGPE